MNNEKPTIQTSNRTQLAKMYGVSVPIFNNWIEINPLLKQTMAPYLNANKKAFPPEVVRIIFEILGDPRD